MSAQACSAPDPLLVAAAQSRAVNAGAVLSVSYTTAAVPVVVVARWNLMREFATLAEAEALLDRMGAPA